MIDELFVTKIVEEIERRKRNRRIELRTVMIKAVGMKFAHRLGYRPSDIRIYPLADVRWWFYQEPDSRYLYLKASADVKALITVGG